MTITVVVPVKDGARWLGDLLDAVGRQQIESHVEVLVVDSGSSDDSVAIAREHGVRLIEAALQFPLLHPSVVSVIPGGQRPSEVESNRSLIDAKLPSALWADLKQEGLMRADAPTA